MNKHIDNCEMLHGGIKDEERMAAVDRFQNDKNVFVFLISKPSTSSELTQKKLIC